jgi:hypothetical protein
VTAIAVLLLGAGALLLMSAWTGTGPIEAAQQAVS